MVAVAKKYVAKSLGINTEAPLTEWPEGYVMDVKNMDILTDGSYKKRPGLAAEDSLVPIPQGYVSNNAASEFYLWENAGNIQGQNYLVSQLGSVVYISTARGLNAVEESRFEIDLVGLSMSVFSSAIAARAEMARGRCSFSSGMGRLYMTHPYVNPRAIEFDPFTAEFTLKEILVLERDFMGAKDDTSVDLQPTTLSDAHRYNLFSRGWTQANIDQYFTDKGKYPAKNMIMQYGYRTYDTVATPAKTYAPEEGIKEFSSDKMFNEFFSQASAPQGHLISIAWDTTQVWSGIGSGDFTTKPITSITATKISDSDFTITCSATAHGLVTNNTTNISGMELLFAYQGFRSRVNFTQKVNGIFTVTGAPTVDSFTFTLSIQNNKDNSFRDTISTGTYTSTAPLIGNNTFGEELDTRFRLTSYFLGRVWYAGLEADRTKNRIYFSQVVDDPDKAGYCLTEADPTDLRISDPVATDGGYIAINELGYAQKLVPFGNSMLVFSTEGIWQIGPGDLGFFSPLSYSVRRITNVGTRGRYSIVEAEEAVFYWGTDGIYIMRQDSNSGFLTVQNISQTTINRLIARIKNFEDVIGIYDDLDKRILWYFGDFDTASSELEGSFYFAKIGPTASSYQTLGQRVHTLVFDLRSGSFTRYDLNQSVGNDAFSSDEIGGAWCWPMRYQTDRKERIRVLYGTLTATAQFYTYSNDTSYTDLGTKDIEAYVIAGPETLGDAGRNKQAPFVHCFFRRVEGSACLMQPIWDWSKTTVTGNVGNPMQVYREVTPNAQGGKMVVTKNKVRGKGHSLYLGFHALPGKPLWLEGWQIEYNVSQKL